MSKHLLLSFLLLFRRSFSQYQLERNQDLHRHWYLEILKRFLQEKHWGVKYLFLFIYIEMTKVYQTKYTPEVVAVQWLMFCCQVLFMFRRHSFGGWESLQRSQLHRSSQ